MVAHYSALSIKVIHLILPLYLNIISFRSLPLTNCVLHTWITIFHNAYFIKTNKSYKRIDIYHAQLSCTILLNSKQQ